MAVDYTNTFLQLAEELRIIRKTEALWEHSTKISDALFSQRLLKLRYDETGSEQENDVESAATLFLEKTVGGQLATTHAAQILQMFSAATSDSPGFFAVLDEELSTSDTDVSAGDIAYTYLDEAGKITIQARSGRWGVLRASMIADNESILKNTVTFGAFVAFPTQVGVLVLGAGPVGDDHTLGGTLIFEGTSQDVAQPKLSVKLELTNPLVNGQRIVIAENDLTVGKLFEDGPTGISGLQLDLGPIVETGDDGLILSAHVITTPNAGDMTVDKFEVQITREAGDKWRIKVFKDADRTIQVGDNIDTVIVPPAVLIPVGTTGTVPVTINLDNGTVWKFDFDKTAATAHLGPGLSDDDIAIQLKIPRVGERWTIPVTNTELGQYATKLARISRASLRSVTAGTPPSITDTQASSISMS